eukprot:107405_1
MLFIIQSFVVLLQLCHLNALTCTMDEIYDYANAKTIPWPACSCEVYDFSAETQEDVVYSTYFAKQCWSCHCGENENGKYHSCTLESNKVDSAQDWNLFECPRSTQCVDDTGVAHYAYTGWFGSIDGECSKYCYCTGQGTTVCEEGWDNILGSSNEALLTSFMNECETSLQDCVDDASRWFTTDFGSQCTLCPKCDCDSHGVGSEWYTEHAALWDYSKVHCSHCQCMDARHNYANCTHLDTYVEGNGQCPPPSVLSCQTGITTQTSCDSQSPTQWCTWTEVESGYYMGCGNDARNMWCEAYGVEDGCIAYDIPQTSECEFDVDSGVQTITKHLYCCRGEDNCNILSDTSSCTASTGLSSVLNEYYGCLYADRLYDQYFCDESDTEVTCNGISAMYGLVNKCYCGYIGDMYSRVGKEWKVFLEDEMDQFLTEASEWNDVLGCNIDFECDLDSGVLSNAAIETTDITSTGDESENNENQAFRYNCIVYFIVMVCSCVWSV